MMPPVLIVTGPTASGKKNIALDIAKKYNGEIVSADSRKIYRFMDIGTAKPSWEQRSEIPHHLIDIVDPDTPFSAWEWLEYASQAVKDISMRKKLPIISGGTGFYIAAFMDGLTPGISADRSIREKLKREFAQYGNTVMYDELKRCDPIRALELHPNDIMRVMRALEVCRSTGSTFTEIQNKPRINGGSYRYLSIGIMRERKELYSRINNRVDKMLESGLLDEVQALLKKGYDRSLTAFDTVGYKEWFSFIDNNQSFNECLELVKQNTRHYAKRQITWFNARHEIYWFDKESKETDTKMYQLIDTFITADEKSDTVENS